MFTLKAKDRKPFDLISILRDIAKEWAFQKEKGVGENAYEHYQGVFSLEKGRQTMGVVKNMLGFNDVHLETCRDWPAAKKYATKTDTRIEGPWSSWGPDLDPKYQLQEANFYEWQKTVKDWLMAEPDDRKVKWIYDEIGGNGKTKFVLHMYDNHGAVRYNSGKESDIAYSYKSERIVLFDFQRSKQFINYSTIEDLKNGHLFSGKYESCAKRFNPPHVVVFANQLPDFSNLSLDRWEVYKLEDKKMVREYEFIVEGVKYNLK